MVQKVGFAEAEKLDDQYYASLSELERLEILMELRSLIDVDTDKIEKFVFQRSLHEEI